MTIIIVQNVFPVAADNSLRHCYLILQTRPDRVMQSYGHPCSVPKPALSIMMRKFFGQPGPACFANNEHSHLPLASGGRYIEVRDSVLHVSCYAMIRALFTIFISDIESILHVLQGEVPFSVTNKAFELRSPVRSPLNNGSCSHLLSTALALALRTSLSSLLPWSKCYANDDIPSTNVTVLKVMSDRPISGFVKRYVNSRYRSCSATQS